MAIDFSQVKNIVIPEGSVKKITDSQGNVLWNKYTIYRDDNHFIYFTNGNSNNYIDLGINFSTLWRVEGCFYQNRTGAWKRLFGIGINRAESWNNSFQLVSADNDYQIKAVINGNQYTFGTTTKNFKNNAKNYISFGNRGNNNFSLWCKNANHDWTELGTQSYPTNSNGKRCYLLNGYEDGCDSTYRIGHMIIYDAANTSTWPNTKIHDYYIAQRADNVLGLWDDVTQTFIEPNCVAGSVQMTTI